MDAAMSRSTPAGALMERQEMAAVSAISAAERARWARFTMGLRMHRLLRKNRAGR